MTLIIELIISAIMAMVGHTFAPLGPAPTIVDPIPTTTETVFGDIQGCIVGKYCDTPESAGLHTGGLWPECLAEDDESKCVFIAKDGGDSFASLGDGTFVFVHVWEDTSFREITNNRPAWIRADWAGPIPNSPNDCGSDSECIELNPWIDPDHAGY